MNRIILILAGALMVACGSMNGYHDAQQAAYAKMLTKSEQSEINQKGELSKAIVMYDTGKHSSERGTLRILKTASSREFNFVETGEWIRHGYLSGDVGNIHNPEFLDTTFYDNLGNSIYRQLYYKTGNNKYELAERWFSRRSPDTFIRHAVVFKNGIINSEVESKVVDFNTPRSDRLKKVIAIVRREYSSAGKLVSTMTYDKSGTLRNE
jgi:hypothetical protein